MATVTIWQYVQIGRKLTVEIPDGADINYARDIVDGLPIDSSKALDDSVQFVRDWEYVPNSDMYEDEDGNTI